MSIDIPVGTVPNGTDLGAPVTAEPQQRTVLTTLKDKLAAARMEAADKLAFKLPVPRMPILVVEYKPVDQRIWQGIIDKAQKDTPAMVLNCRMLAAFVRGIYVDDGGDLISADLVNQSEPAPRFEQRLAESLDLQWTGDQADLVRAIYLTDFDVISTAAAVLELSGFGTSSEIEASVRGN